MVLISTYNTEVKMPGIWLTENAKFTQSQSINDESFTDIAILPYERYAYSELQANSAGCFYINKY